MMLEPSSITDLVHVGIQGAVGRIHLNRPKALNSLNTDMCLAVSQALLDWEQNDRVAAVVLTGEGRGLCAGGDVVAVRENRLNGVPESFFEVEYGMIKLIAAYSKPIVAVMHGIVMGGGLGISVHASHRVVTPSTRVAMPEGRIGFWCDVGMTYPLTHHSPGQTGVAFALTGAIGWPEEAIGLKLADCMLGDDDDIPELIKRLANGESPDHVLKAMGTVPDEQHIEERRVWVDPCFSADDPAEIIARLLARPEAEAQAAAETLLELSPLSLHIILKALRKAEQLDSLNAVLDMDLVIATNFTQLDSDFDAGVNSQLVTKDKQPTWIHDSLDEVPVAVVDRFFE